MSASISAQHLAQWRLGEEEMKMKRHRHRNMLKIGSQWQGISESEKQ
jgi:hypothetical protein